MTLGDPRDIHTRSERARKVAPRQPTTRVLEPLLGRPIRCLTFTPATRRLENPEIHFTYF